MINVLVSSAGTGSAVTIIKTLKSQSEIPLRVIAMDTDPSAPGLHLADERFISPKATSTEFKSFLEKLARDMGQLYLFPTHSTEIAVLAGLADELRSNGVQSLLPIEAVIRLCDDKSAFAQFASAHNILHPQTFNDVPATAPLPLILKPRIGSGSRGTFYIRNESDRTWAASLQGNHIVQELIKGDEITVDFLANQENKVVAISPRLRISVRDGQMIKGVTLDAAAFIEPVQKLCASLKLQGPCNAQYIHHAGRGLVLIEVNPRYAAGGLMLSIESGVNIPLMALQLMRNKPLPSTLSTPTPGIRMSKYWQEIFWSQPL